MPLMTRDPEPALEHRLELALDYGQFVLHGGEGEEDTELALLEAALATGPSAGDGHTVVVCSPHQNNFEMPVVVQVWATRPPADEDDWQQISEARLHIGEYGLNISSPVDTWESAPVPPGDYIVEIAGTGFVGYGWPGTTTPGDHWRIRCWPDDGSELRAPRVWVDPELAADSTSALPRIDTGITLPSGTTAAAAHLVIPFATEGSAPDDQARQREQEAAERAREEWGGEPIAALADIYCARDLGGYDRALAESIAGMDVAELRALSVFCAERAYEYAGLADRPWVRPALTALRSGDPFPEHFQDAAATFARLDEDEYSPGATQFRSVLRVDGDVPARRRNPYDRGNISRPHFAVNTLFHARLADPLQGALAGLNEAAITFGDRVEVLFAGIRAEFGLPPRY
ncbi:hypothetical protein ACFWM1_11730 [Nocardia sp. NPDC058379]|uniref:hypothetical protein n=1 Tax=unclassified Nocardia TaxID=2637762 RepID=UPI003661F21C